MIKPLHQFISLVGDFPSWDSKQQVDYLAFYLHSEKGLNFFTARDILDLYNEIPLTPYSRTANYLSEQAAVPKGKYVKMIKGYALSKPVKDSIAAILLPNSTSKTKGVQVVSSALATLRGKVIDPKESSVLDEVILCFEIGANRSAVVMMWALTIAHLRNKVLLSRKFLKNFNEEVDQWNAAHPKNILPNMNHYDDFGDIQEHKFIQLLYSAKIINKSQHEILVPRLKERNSAGHPTGTTFGDNKAAAFIEDLVENILS